MKEKKITERKRKQISDHQDLIKLTMSKNVTRIRVQNVHVICLKCFIHVKSTCANTCAMYIILDVLSS